MVKSRTVAGALCVLLAAGAAQAQDPNIDPGQKYSNQLAKSVTNVDQFASLLYGLNGDAPAVAMAGGQPMPASPAQFKQMVAQGQIAHFDVQGVFMTQPLHAGLIQYAQPTLTDDILAVPAGTVTNCSQTSQTSDFNFTHSTSDTTTLTVASTTGASITGTFGFSPPSLTGGPSGSVSVNINTSETDTTATATTNTNTWSVTAHPVVPARSAADVQMVIMQKRYDGVPWSADVFADPGQAFTALLYFRGPYQPAPAPEWIAQPKRTRLGAYLTQDQLKLGQVSGTFNGVEGYRAELRYGNVRPVTDVECGGLGASQGAGVRVAAPMLAAGAKVAPMANPVAVFPATRR
ncbi:ETX/MTX2 family pore-forming toxin [Phenylobacterium sp.]|uniref:ETX/MTX2 family pore-forming toxin n=1 Tax=Phenylobacterium sp. TaxID=1871053 RepID=UPI003919AFC9